MTTSQQDQPIVISIEQHAQTIYNQSFKDPWAPPMMLPPQTQSFIGHEADLQWLTSQIMTKSAGTAMTIAIYGHSGIGKTALVAETVARLRTQDAFSTRFPDGIYYYAFNTYPLPALVYEELAHIFDTFDHEREVDPFVAASRRLSRRRALLIFDGLEVLAEDQISSFCHLGGDNVVLLVSRRAKDAEHATCMRNIGRLALAEGGVLLQKLGGAQATDQSAVEQLVSRMMGIPLALQLVGGYLSTHQESADAYLKWFEEDMGTALKNGAQPAPSLIKLFQHTYDKLDPCAQQIFALQGLLAPMPFPSELIQPILAVSDETLQQALDALVKVGVLRQVEKHYEVSHSLVHAFSKTNLPAQIHELPAALAFPASSWLQQIARAGSPRRKAAQIYAAWKDQLLNTLQTHFAKSDHLDTAASALWLPHVLPLIATEYATEPQSLILASIFNSAASNASVQGKDSLTQPLLQQALSIREQQLGAEHPDTAQSLNDLAELYIRQKKYTEAEPLLKRALAIREQQVELIYPDAALTLNNLGTLYRAQGNYDAAEPLFKRAFAVCNQLAGPVHADTAHVINNLALLYNVQGKQLEAEHLFQLSLAIREQQLGPTHPYTAQSLHRLATLSLTLGKDAEAERLFKRALAVRERHLGAEHPDTLISLYTLATFYRTQQKYAAAESLYKRALTTREHQAGTPHPDMLHTLIDLATIYHEQQKYALAEPLFQRALSICKQQVKPIHPDMLRTLNHLATLYQDQGKYALAEPLFQRALIICKQQVGSRHPDMAYNLNNLAVLYKNQRKYAEAEPLFQRALTIREQQLGANHPDTIQSINNLAALYRTRQKYAAAEPLFQRVLTIREQQLGVDHPDTAISLNNLAALYKSQEKYALAAPLFQRALAILEPHLGRSHPTTITVKRNIAALSHLINEEKTVEDAASQD
jgi:Tfp pilus assembly protein PilF